MVTTKKENTATKKKPESKRHAVAEDKPEAEKKTKKEEETIEKKMTAESICPSCKKDVPGYKCRLCGATKNISSVSGNVVWMKNGRVVAAFDDERQAYVRMAERCGIPKSDWPEKFRDQ